MQLAMLLSRDFSLRLLLTLGHFLWEGGLIALATFLVLQMLRRASARTRCNVLMAAMLAMGAAPVATFIVLSAGDAKTVEDILQVGAGATSAAVEGQVQLAASPPLPLITPVGPNAGQLASAAASPFDRGSRIQSLWQSLAIVYLGIVVVMLARIVFGLAANQRLWWRGQAVEAQIVAALARQMAVLGMTLKPAIAYCAQISTPMVIGIFRPTILLPISLASSLSMQQIDSILAHELAHIRRLDPIFILVQRVIEALLFFHPLLWVISRWLDMERERACDQVVVRAGHDHLDYASALIRMGEGALKKNRLPMQLAAAGKASQLRWRIRSLLEQGPTPTVRLTLRSCVMLLAVILISCLLLPRLWGQAQPTTNPTTAPALLSKEQLLQRVTELRSRVKDISVVTEDIVLKGPSDVVRRSQRTVLLKREMIYMDQLYGTEENPTAFHARVSFDGRQTTTDGRPPGRAMITKGRSRELDTEGVAFFSVNLICPPRNAGVQSRSLFDAFGQCTVSIRKDPEPIDGHLTEVVEFVQPFNGKLIVWFDLDRGLLPLRQQAFLANNKLWQEINVEKAYEVEKGLWFAIRSKTKVFNVFRDLPELGDGTETLMIVNQGRDGVLLQVNTNPDDSLFDLAARLAPGTMVTSDEDLGKMWRVVGFGKERKLASAPATAPLVPVGGQGERLPLASAASPPPVEPVREYDLKPWGEAVEGVHARFRLPKEDGARRAMIDLQNTGLLNWKLDVGRPRLELDGKWYTREKPRESFSMLPPGRNYQAMGPISLDIQWIDEQTQQPLAKTAGRHTMRVKYVALPVDGKGKSMEVITAPLIIQFDAHGMATTQPAQ